MDDTEIDVFPKVIRLGKKRNNEGCFLYSKCSYYNIYATSSIILPS